MSVVLSTSTALRSSGKPLSVYGLVSPCWRFLLRRQKRKATRPAMRMATPTPTPTPAPIAVELDDSFSSLPSVWVLLCVDGDSVGVVLAGADAADAVLLFDVDSVCEAFDAELAVEMCVFVYASLTMVRVYTSSVGKRKV